MSVCHRAGRAVEVLLGDCCQGDGWVLGTGGAGRPPGMTARVPRLWSAAAVPPTGAWPAPAPTDNPDPRCVLTMLAAPGAFLLLWPFAYDAAMDVTTLVSGRSQVA